MQSVAILKQDGISSNKSNENLVASKKTVMLLFLKFSEAQEMRSLGVVLA